MLGETCTDVFIYGTVRRLAPEAPSPVLVPTKQKTNLGMAGNVYANLDNLGVNCELMTNHNYKKVTKTRFIDNVTNTLFLRIDQGDNTIVEAPIEFDPGAFDAIVISDYNKGFLSKDVIRQITEAHPMVFLDTKKRLGDWCKSAFFNKD